MRHKLLLLASSLLVFVSSAIADTLLFQDDFENASAFATNWALVDYWTEDAAPDMIAWGIVPKTFGYEGTHSGTNKLYCAGIGNFGTAIKPQYTPTDLDTIHYLNGGSAIERDIDLTGYGSASLSLWYRYKIPVDSGESGTDAMSVMIDSDIIYTTRDFWEQPADAWLNAILPLNDYVGGVHRLRIEFYADSSNMFVDSTPEGYADSLYKTNDFEGIYIDDVAVFGNKNSFPNDYDRDGNTDVLLQNGADQGLRVLYLAGSTCLNYQPICTNVASSGWTVRAVSDVDANGTVDVIVQKGADLRAWLLTEAASYMATGWFSDTNSSTPLQCGSGWRLAGMVDLDDNGSDDLVFQLPSTDGRVGVWHMNGTNRVSSGWLLDSTNGLVLVTAQTIRGFGDFYHDGSKCMLRQDSSGKLSFLRIMGSKVVSASTTVVVGKTLVNGVSTPVMTFSPSAVVIQINDFDQDGYPDLLVKYTDGRLAIWYMQGKTIIAAAWVGAAAPVITPNGATYTNSISVSLGSWTTGGTIRYTLNGTDPTNSSAIYTSPFTLNTSSTVKAKVFFGTWNSGISSAQFTRVVPPSITIQPLGKSVIAGTNVVFAVTATGMPLAYQWRFEGTNIVGATNSTYAITNVQPTHAGNYNVVVRNLAGTVTSADAGLIVNLPPSITSHPQSQTLPAGQTATLSVAASGSGVLSYQWRKNMTNYIAGATNSTYTILNVQPAHSGNYSVVVRSPYGAKVSSNAVLSVYSCSYALAPDSAVFPTNGGSASVSVTANGSCPWSVVKTNDWITITSPTTAEGNGTFSYTVDPNSGPARAAFITVQGKPHAISQQGVESPGKYDFNGDGLADILWQGPNWSLAVWAMNGTNYLGTLPLQNGNTAVGWRAFGIGDFNDDGSPDVVFQNTSNGKLLVWFMNQTNLLGTNLLCNGLAPAPAWRAIAAADFNSDGQPDLLLQNTNGTSAVWLMNGTNRTAGVALRNGVAMPAGWQIAGTGDFNADGQTDIVWRHSDGRVMVWYLVNTTYMRAVLLRTGAADTTGWRLRAIADFSLDGATDLLWQNIVTRQTACWFLNGTNYLGSSLFRSATTGWSIVGPK